MSFALAEARVILLDFQLPGISGTEAIAAMLRRFPGVPIIAVSASEDRRDASAALRAGARHFISKAVSTEVLADVIRRVLGGDCSASPWITPSGAGTLEVEGDSPLTPRQLEVLHQLTLGRSNKVIAYHLGLSENTVRVHVAAILDHLGVVSRVEAILEAQRRGLVQAAR